MIPDFAPASAQTSLPLYICADGQLPDLTPAQAAWASAQGFTGAAGQLCVLPAEDGRPAGALFGRDPSRMSIARAAAALPEGDWALSEGTEEDALAWLLAGYRFDRYKSSKPQKARLICPEGVDPERVRAIAEGEALTRDLINTPASDMGPQELESAAAAVAERFGAKLSVIRGEDLIAQNFPMIHAVGRASPRAPRLLDLRWGESGPMLTLVGKGVCFDTGGLNIKPGSSMGLMKKDMGGAATVLGLASMIMALGLKLRLRVLIPAVENAISGDAFRPQDILTSRKGLTVEVNNTDAEGRLVLADALAYGAEENPDLMLCMATLTGAARVALGPDIPPFYTDSDHIAVALTRGASEARDPLWRMPFWEPYETMIEPAIADLDNAPAGGMAGSITAALFLRRFVSDPERFAHFDIYGWQPSAAPARPKGGVGQGARAILASLPSLLPDLA
jgi:leucyl aminopeptidase